MSTLLRYRMLIALAGCLLLVQAATAAEANQGNLVSTKWLEQNLKNPNVVILDASPGQVYAAKHIPGAVSADMMSYGVKDKSATEMQQLLQAWGVSSGKKVVFYDQGGSNMATRMLWAFYYRGVPAKDLLVLDGGLAKWQSDGLPVAKEATTPPKGSFVVKDINGEIKADRAEVLTASGDTGNSVLIDALDPDWHYGQIRVFDRAGHIPNSVLLPADDFYNPDKTFKSAEEIRRMLKYVGVRPEQRIYTYCGGGVNASVPFFALKFIVKYPNVKMYAGSEMDWLADERGLPYWTYDAPFLMRKANWLQWAGGQRIRMYVGADVSIVDVRPEEAYRAGHLPFALNIPSDAFSKNLRQPEKLPEILGPAGVNAAHEAIVVSGAGLTKESALAFVMLERLGQKKVSILMGSPESWTQLGYPPVKDVTAVGERKGRFDVTIPPTQYAANLRNEVMVANVTKTAGLYPKVFIASGKEIPPKPPEGKVVHIPYTDLLDADGSPKAANVISKALTKAGVPRYAELVCFSDDPAEAAVNYFILKLMGYPDAKVLAN